MLHGIVGYKHLRTCIFKWQQQSACSPLQNQLPLGSYLWMDLSLSEKNHIHRHLPFVMICTHTHAEGKKKKNHNKTNLCHCNVSMLKRNHHLVIAADWGGASVIFYCARCATQLPHPTVYSCQSDYSDSHHRGCTEVFKKLRRKGKTVPQRSEPKAPRFKSDWILFM